MNKQKTINSSKPKSDHTKKPSKMDTNNNKRKGNDASNGIIPKLSQKMNARYAQTTFNYPTQVNICLKINDKSKGGEYVRLDDIFPTK